MAQSQNIEYQYGKQLCDWAYQEMHFHPLEPHVNAQLPTEEDFKRICRGPVIDIWKFVIENVRSAETARKIRGNLALNDHKAQEEKAQLSSELETLMADNKLIESENEQLQQELLDTERSLQNSMDTIRNQRRKAMLLRRFSEKCSTETAHCDEFSKRLIMKAKQLQTKTRTKSTGEVYYAKETSLGRKGSEFDIETACCKSVGESCSSIAQFLHDVLHGPLRNDAPAFNQRKDQLWTSLETMMSEYTIGQIINALMIKTQDSVIDIREKTEHIDIRKDAEKLQFKYENSGALVDMSSAGIALQGLDQLQEYCQAQHIQRFFEIQQNKNESWKLSQQIEVRKAKIDELLQKRHMGRPEELELARKHVDAKLALAGASASLQCYREEGNILKVSIEKAAKQSKVLREKHQKIQDFKALAERKQELIRVLVNQNTSSFGRLASQRSEIVDYVEKSMSGHKDQILSVLQQSQGGIQREVQKFTELSMPYLLHTHLQDTTKVSLLDMLIHQIDRGEKTVAGRTLLQTMHTLKYPLYKVPEYFLLRCVEVKCEVDQIETLLHYHNVRSQRLAMSRVGNKDPASSMTELCEKMEDYNQHQLDNVLRKLTERINQASGALTNCGKLRNLAQDWWEQPAQYTIPWVKLDNMNIQQYKEKWTLLAAEVHQAEANEAEASEAEANQAEASQVKQ